MKNGHEESGRFQQWEKLYKDALFESDVHKMPGRLELAKHAVLDRLEDATYTRKKQMYQAQELEALRDAPPVHMSAIVRYRTWSRLP
jgi:hypothetical protein